MLALGTLLDSDEIQGSVLLSNLEGLGVVGHEDVVMGRWVPLCGVSSGCG